MLTEKIDKLDKEFTQVHKDLQTKLQEIEKKANRPQLGAEEKNVRLEVKKFNIALKAHAQRHSRPMPAEVDLEGFANYKKSLDLYLKGGRDLMSPDEIKAAQIGNDPSGGYLVTPEIDYEITRVVTNLGAMRSLATVRSIGSSSLTKVAQTSGAQFGGWGD